MLLLHSASRFCFSLHPHFPITLRSRCTPSSLTVRSRSSLPFLQEDSKFNKELTAAIDVVEKACRLCVDIKSSLFSSSDGQIFQKNDETPVTVADFGVQALISLELHRLFPSIPLVAEEDSSFLQSNDLANYVVNTVNGIGNTNFEDTPLTQADVLRAIDRGGKNAFGPEAGPETYWILDPIDGTKGFLKGSDALYVVGLALIVDGEIVLGVMGCPNWPEAASKKSAVGYSNNGEIFSGSGIVMAAHIGCGTWVKSISHLLNATGKRQDSWARCFVDDFCFVHKAHFCISDSQTWESLPLSTFYNVSTGVDISREKDIILLPTCCGSLCKYLMVASGRASVFILRAKTEKTIKAWDHAVGLICVHEAGGKVTDWKGSQLDFSGDRDERRSIYPSDGVLVTNGNLHSQLLKMIRSSSSAVQ